MNVREAGKTPFTTHPSHRDPAEKLLTYGFFGNDNSNKPRRCFFGQIIIARLNEATCHIPLRLSLGPMAVPNWIQGPFRGCAIPRANFCDRFSVSRRAELPPPGAYKSFLLLLLNTGWQSTEHQGVRICVTMFSCRGGVDDGGEQKLANPIRPRREEGPFRGMSPGADMSSELGQAPDYETGRDSLEPAGVVIPLSPPSYRSLRGNSG